MNPDDIDNHFGPDESLSHPSANPFDPLVRVWKYAEKVALSVSILIVFGTVGYLSLHSLHPFG